MKTEKPITTDIIIAFCRLYDDSREIFISSQTSLLQIKHNVYQNQYALSDDQKKELVSKYSAQMDAAEKTMTECIKIIIHTADKIKSINHGII